MKSEKPTTFQSALTEAFWVFFIHTQRCQLTFKAFPLINKATNKRISAPDNKQQSAAANLFPRCNEARSGKKTEAMILYRLELVSPACVTDSLSSKRSCLSQSLACLTATPRPAAKKKYIYMMKKNSDSMQLRRQRFAFQQVQKSGARPNTGCRRPVFVSLSAPRAPGATGCGRRPRLTHRMHNVIPDGFSDTCQRAIFSPSQ